MIGEDMKYAKVRQFLSNNLGAFSSTNMSDVNMDDCFCRTVAWVGSFRFIWGLHTQPAEEYFHRWMRCWSNWKICATGYSNSFYFQIIVPARGPSPLSGNLFCKLGRLGFAKEFCSLTAWCAISGICGVLCLFTAIICMLTASIQLFRLVRNEPPFCRNSQTLSQKAIFAIFIVIFACICLAFATLAMRRTVASSIHYGSTFWIQVSWFWGMWFDIYHVSTNSKSIISGDGCPFICDYFGLFCSREFMASLSESWAVVAPRCWTKGCWSQAKFLPAGKLRGFGEFGNDDPQRPVFEATCHSQRTLRRKVGNGSDSYPPWCLPKKHIWCTSHSCQSLLMTCCISWYSIACLTTGNVS